MVSEPRRGQIYWVDFTPARGSEQAGIRPALVVQNDIGNRASSTTIVAAVTSRLPSADYPFLVRLPDGLLPKRSVVKCDQLMTVTKQRLGDLLATLPPDLMARVDDALLVSLGVRR
jgi:mRNA interferase MazF